jgi:hypothetical protein
VAPVRRPRAHRSGCEVLKDATEPTLASHSISFPSPSLCARRAEKSSRCCAARSAAIVRAHRHTTVGQITSTGPPPFPLPPPPLCLANRAKVRAYWPIPPQPPWEAPRRSWDAPWLGWLEPFLTSLFCLVSFALGRWCSCHAQGRQWVSPSAGAAPPARRRPPPPWPALPKPVEFRMLG